MRAAVLWKTRPRRIQKMHQWRARRSDWGELVQWVELRLDDTLLARYEGR